MSEQQRTWGFRLSIVDLMVLIAAVVATWLYGSQLGDMVGAIPMAVGHFFLFCNVFRIHRTKEFIWAACCLVNVSAWAVADNLWWPGILAIQTPPTVLLIVWEIRGPWYHGIFAKRLNPCLDDYLEHRL